MSRCRARGFYIRFRMENANLHRLNARILGLFLVAHLFNHATIVFGFGAHLAVMDVLAAIYRLRLIEVPLLFLFAVQILLGLRLVWARGWPDNSWGRAQVVSGLYLAFFLVQHMVAVVMTPLSYDGMDTNVYWAASVVSRPPFVWYFAPYYVLAVMALFTHIAAAMRFARWPDPASGMQRALPLVGLGFGIVIVAGLMVHAQGGLPAPYVAYLDSMWPR